MFGRFSGSVRMVPWAIIAAALGWAVYELAPAQLEVFAWKAMLITGFAWLGYRIDVALFPYARPHAVLERFLPRSAESHLLRVTILAAAAMLRRAIVVAAVLSAGSQAL